MSPTRAGQPSFGRLLHTTRRAALAALGAGTGTWLTGCDLAPRRAPAREPAIYEVLAPEAQGRRRRVDAWNQRYGDETGVRLSPVGPDARFRGDDATALHLLADTASGARAGIAWLSHDRLQDVARARAVAPLGDLARRDRFDLKSFVPCALQPAYSLDGALVSLPDAVDAGQLYFNRQHLLGAGIDFRRAGLDFERPDSRWDTLRRTALDLLFVRRDGAPWFPGAVPLEVWGWANGGGWVADGGRRATFDREENAVALDWLVSAANEAGGARLPAPEQLPPEARLGTDADPVAGHPFLEGRVTLWFDSGRFTSTLAWTRPDFPIGYVESPRRHRNTPLVTWARSSGYSLRAGSPDALWPALNFLVSRDAVIVDADAEAAQAPLAAGSGRPRWYPPFTGQLPTDKSLARRYRMEVKVPDEGRDHALEQLRHARPRERCPAADVWPLVRRAHSAALAGLPARDALAQAQHDAQALLDAAWRGSR